MPTVAELAARQYQEVAYLFVIEGWPIAFTNRAELAGSGVSSWIGTSYGNRTVAIGLEPPESVKLGVGILESGMPIDDDLTVTVVDRDGHLIEFNEDEFGTALGQRLAPEDDPADATLIDSNGVNANIHGKWVNGEAISSSGERRRYQILPTGTLPGYDHAATNTAEENTLRPSTLQAAARWWEGRPCALYLLRRDPVAGTWASWESQNESGYSRLWWGTLRAARAESFAWTLECEGPSSWLRRVLNANRPDVWARLTTPLELDDSQRKIACAFAYKTALGGYQTCGRSVYEAVDVITGETRSELSDSLDTRLKDVAADISVTPGAETFSTWQSGTVEVNDGEVSLSVADNNGGSAYGGILALRMHMKIWLHLGWDLTIQDIGLLDPSTEQEVHAALDAGEFVTPWVAAEADPLGKFWTATFTTMPVGLNWSTSPSRVDGDGEARLWRPVYDKDVAYLDSAANQLWDYGGHVSPYIEGQLARPPADKEIDAVACDATGFMAVKGTYKASIDGDEVQHWQLAKVSWVRSTTETAIGLDSQSRVAVWCERWLDTQQFGVPEAVKGVWAVADLQRVPVAVLGYNIGAPDAAHVVLLRLLLSSGTASWTGTEGDPAAALTPGANGHPDALAASGEDIRGTDLEIADLGLCIPYQMIDWQSFRRTAEATPGGKDGPLNKTRMAFIGPFDSQEAIMQLIKPRGWCFALRGARYGLFARGAPLTIDDVEVSITQADIAGDPNDLPPSESVDFHPLEPIDLIEVRYGGNQLDGGAGEKTETFRARDRRAPQRRGNATADIDGRSLMANRETFDWKGDFHQLWAEQLATWYAEPHAMVTVRVKGDKARDLWPGTIVRYTSPWPATRNGAYGMTGVLGRVVSVDRDLQTLAATVEILVQAGDPLQGSRRFAPLARLLDDVATVEARHNAATRTLYCHADAWGHDEDDFHDVTFFAEPAWLGVGGDALAYVWSSWDGVTWEKTAEFVVESVDAANDTITYEAGTLDGTIWERRYTVLTLAPWEDQSVSSWPRALFGVYCGADGKFGASNSDGFPWVG